MVAWGYKISLQVLKKYFMSEWSERVQYMSTQEDKFLQSDHVIKLVRKTNVDRFRCFDDILSSSSSSRK